MQGGRSGYELMGDDQPEVPSTGPLEQRRYPLPMPCCPRAVRFPLLPTPACLGWVCEWRWTRESQESCSPADESYVHLLKQQSPDGSFLEHRTKNASTRFLRAAEMFVLSHSFGNTQP